MQRYCSRGGSWKCCPTASPSSTAATTVADRLPQCPSSAFPPPATIRTLCDCNFWRGTNCIRQSILGKSNGRKLNLSSKHRIPVLPSSHWTGRTRCMHLPHALMLPAAWPILVLSLQSTRLVSHQPSSAQSRQVRLFVFHLICPCEMLD